MSELRLIKMSWVDAEFGLLLSRNELLSRGWTMKMINEKLGGPDCLGINPRGGAWVNLYSEARVRRSADCG